MEGIVCNSPRVDLIALASLQSERTFDLNARFQPHSCVQLVQCSRHHISIGAGMLYAKNCVLPSRLIVGFHFLKPQSYSAWQIIYPGVLYEVSFSGQGIVQFSLAYINSYKVNRSQNLG